MSPVRFSGARRAVWSCAGVLDWTRACGVVGFTDVICGSCAAVEELAARDALIASLREENEALRVKVAALAEIAFGGSERRGAKGSDSDEELRGLGDEGPRDEGEAGEEGAPGAACDADADADGTEGGGGPAGTKRGVSVGGRRVMDGAVTIISRCESSSATSVTTSAAAGLVERPMSRSPVTRSRARSPGGWWSIGSSTAASAIGTCHL